MASIDFVITWVDGNDPEWQARKAKCLGLQETDDRTERYRDWDLMRYWFRGVEKYAPWVRKIWFICDQEPPAWLNRECPKLQIVRHQEFIPQEYLPTFSSVPIELNMHRIKGLSERFVYFNDDTFIISRLKEDFFFRKGLPRDSALLNPIPTTDLKKDNGGQRIFTAHLNNAEYANRDYDFRSTVKKNLSKWYNLRYGSSLVRNILLSIWPRFVGFYEPHLPQAYLKKSFEEAWEADGDILEVSSAHPIRSDQDINQWLIRHRQLMDGKFIPRKPIKNAVFDLTVQCKEAVETIRGQRIPMICMNDGEMEDREFEAAKEILCEAFEAILPETSAFEAETGAAG